MSEREQDLIDAAREIYGDYLSYGVVLQQDENGEYGEQSAIGLLAAALKAYS